MLPAIGVAIREQNRAILGDPSVNAAEVSLRPGDDPSRIETDIRDHDFDVLNINVGAWTAMTSERISLEHIRVLSAVAEQNQAASISFRSPVLNSQSAVDAACRNIDALGRALKRVRVYVESVPGSKGGAGSAQADLLSQVLQKTGCGWMLDVVSYFTAARTHGQDAYAFITEVTPCAARVQMHLGGGDSSERSGRYVDNDSRAIPEAVWALYQHTLSVGGHKMQAVFIKRDQNFPLPETWLKEVRHAQFLAERAHTKQRMLRKRELARRA